MSQGVQQSPGGCNCPGCTLCAQVFDCLTGMLLPGASVVVTRSGSSIGNCTTDTTGQCCVSVPGTGLYDVAVTDGGFQTWTGSTYVTCPAGGRVLAVLGNGFSFCVGGCNGLPLQGATVAIGARTFTTAANGCVQVTGMAPGVYPLTISASRFVTASGTITIFGTSCQTASVQAVTLTPTFGYVCISQCAYPLKTTLMATHSAFGAATLVWNGAVWAGTFASGPPGGCGCNGGTMAPDATFDGSTLNAPIAACAPYPISTCPWNLPQCGPFGPNYFGYSVLQQSIICPPAFLWTGLPFTTPACDPFLIGPSVFGPGVTVTCMITE